MLVKIGRTIEVCFYFFLLFVCMNQNRMVRVCTCRIVNFGSCVDASI